MGQVRTIIKKSSNVIGIKISAHVTRLKI